MISAVPEEQAAAFALLRRPQVPTDVLPEDRWERYQTGLIGRRGLNPALSRRTETALGNVWVIPGEGWICLSLAASPDASSLDGGGMVCNSTAHAVAGRLVTWGSSRSGRTLVHGLLPDSIAEVTLTAAGGSMLTVHAVDNAYAAVLSGALVSVRIGGETVLEVGAPEP
jgi:hypothetical protein